MRQVGKEELIAFLRRKAGRRAYVWWNGELIPLSQAFGRASDLPPAERVLCRQDEVLLPRLLEVASHVSR
jgi:hypothetical protein